MRSYMKNSKEACTRILAMCLLADSDLDTEELDESSLLKINQSLGISRLEFFSIVNHYLQDLQLTTGSKKVDFSALDLSKVNEILDEVDDDDKQINLLAVALSACKGSSTINAPEMALFKHIMKYWQINFDDLNATTDLT